MPLNSLCRSRNRHKLYIRIAKSFNSNDFHQISLDKKNGDLAEINYQV